MGKQRNNELARASKQKKAVDMKLQHPRMSGRDIAYALGFPERSTYRYLERLSIDGGILEEDAINAIKKADVDIVLMATSEIIARLSDKKKREEMRADELSRIAKDSQARYSFLAGDRANSKGGEKSLAELLRLASVGIIDVEGKEEEGTEEIEEIKPE